MYVYQNFIKGSIFYFRYQILIQLRKLEYFHKSIQKLHLNTIKIK